MPVNTRMGKVYSTDELIRLGMINSYGQHNHAVLQALHHIKYLENELKRSNELIAYYQEKYESEDDSEVNIEEVDG